MTNICEILRHKSMVPRRLMEKSINEYGVNTYFKSSDLRASAFRSEGRFYYWLTLLVEVEALETRIRPNNKGAYLFSVTEKGKQCYECYLNAHSTYYANHIHESDEDKVGSCILFINPINREATLGRFCTYRGRKSNARNTKTIVR